MQQIYGKNQGLGFSDRLGHIIQGRPKINNKIDEQRKACVIFEFFIEYLGLNINLLFTIYFLIILCLGKVRCRRYSTYLKISFCCFRSTYPLDNFIYFQLF